MNITLYAHGGSGNHGCEALVRSSIKALNPSCHHFSLLSERPADDQKYGVGEIAEIHSSHTSIPTKGISSVLFKIKAKLGKSDSVYYRYLYKNITNKVPNTDLALAIGGDNYCYRGFLERFSVQNELWKQKHIPFALWGCSIDPERITPVMVEDLRKYKFITARESITYEALRSHNLHNVHLVPDTAFLLDSIEKPLPNGFQEGNTVGINISPLVIRQEPKPGIMMENLGILIEHILQNTNMSVALIPHVVWKDNDDRIPLCQLYQKYSNNERVVMIEDTNALELKGYIRKCRFLVAARTHASIAGYSTGVPTLVIGYSVKSRGIATDLFGTDRDYVVPIKSVFFEDTILKSFIWLQSQEDVIRKRYQAFLPEYIKSIEIVKNIV